MKAVLQIFVEVSKTYGLQSDGFAGADGINAEMNLTESLFQLLGDVCDGLLSPCITSTPLNLCIVVFWC